VQQPINDCEAFEFGPYRLIPSKRILLAGQNPVEIGSRAFDILALLMRRRGEVVSRREILDEVWPNLTIDEANLRVQMSDLRRALGSGHEGSAYIKNVQGRGYVFVAPVEFVSPSTQSAVNTANTYPKGRPPNQQQRPVGRDDALDALATQVLTRRFVTIVGPGGIGKTTLAVELGRRLAEEFSNDVCYLDLGSLKEQDLVLPSMATVLGYTVPSDDLLTGLTAFLADRRLLLIVDCCEHVIDVVANAAAKLFQAVQQIHLIATSREVLRADGETVYFMEPLGLPNESKDLTADEALAAASVELFMKRAASSGFAGGLNDHHAPAVAEICRRLDGNPLAIELAASRLVIYGFNGLLDGLRSPAVLSWPGRRHEPRHRTLEATLDWSFRLLSEVEQRILARLSVLVGPFTMQAAQALASDAIDESWTVARAVEELTDKSLVAIVPLDDTYVYRIQDVTRFYAEMKLAQSGERQQVLRRRAQFCADCLRDRNARSRHGIERSGLELGLQVSNIRAALEWCFSDLGDVKLGIDLAAYASEALLDVSMLRECLRWCEIALAHIDGKEPFSKRGLMLQESLALCRMYSMANDNTVGEAITRALDMAVELSERESELHLLAGYNLFLTRRADYLGALRAAEQFATLAQASQDLVEIVASDWMLGSTHNLLGNQHLGNELLERGSARAEESGISKVYFFGFDNRGRGAIGRVWTSWLRGAPEKALRLAKQVLETSVAQRHPVSLCITYLYTATVVLWLRDLEWAERLIETLIEVANKHQLKPYSTGGMALKGELLIVRGRTEAGVAIIKAVLEPLRTQQLNIMLVPTLRAYAEGLARLGEVEEAERTIAALVQRAETVSPTYLLPELLRTRGNILLARSPRDEHGVEVCYRRAIAQAQSDGALGWELRAAISLARLLQHGNRLGEAAELLEHTLSMFTEGFATGDLVEAHELLQSLNGLNFDRLEPKLKDHEGLAREKSVPLIQPAKGGGPPRLP
jgi:predicted ATPase/DNA-binding winged helix-turn-helix (wHTH) protein